MASLSIIPALAQRHRPHSAWLRLPQLLATMWRNAVTRRYLSEMDARMLKDIGLSRAEALEEASRRPWDFGSC
jgi:uncharacterized protein YjiS (DUF1127 family)